MEHALNENIAAQPEVRWNFREKYFFRFAAVYLVIYIFPFPLSAINFLDPAGFSYYEGLWHVIVPWFGENILHLPYDINVLPTGSSDKLYDYIQVLMFFILALLISVLWTSLDRKRINYKKLSYWIVVYVRYYLALIMLSYGFAKVFKTQFPFPGDTRLNETYGQSSPMGLVWTFMGYSPMYNYFTGGAEVLAGLMFFFRRTTTYGSLVAITVLSNVVMINFCYDVPVKLYSLHLLLMAIFILSFDIKRVARFFFLNKPVEAVDLSPIVIKKSLRKTFLVLKIIFISLFIFMTVKVSIDPQFPPVKTTSLLLKGTYDVESFTRNNNLIVQSSTEPERWKIVSISPEAGYVSIRMQNDSLQYFTYYLSTADKTINLRPFGNQGSILTYSEEEQGKVILTGEFKTDAIKVELRKKDGSYNLVNRGFHWINEYPFNR